MSNPSPSRRADEHFDETDATDVDRAVDAAIETLHPDDSEN